MRFQDPPGCFGSYVVGAMRTLPYEYVEWALARVGIDYHVEVSGFFYSAPHALIRQQVETRVTERTVEVFHRGRRVAAHARRYGGPRHGTLPDTCRVRIKFGMPGRHRWNSAPRWRPSSASSTSFNSSPVLVARQQTPFIVLS